ncbi:MAG TPA: Crp/Fnr family transcriptional regulator [Cytophagaceae bacterium]|jgi:CRP/FNR family cyclic AMP-dependent transcriptional regulator|nr:Crp/Fnr family transcriptional regulator [Cytophagaceae bacterium]
MNPEANFIVLRDHVLFKQLTFKECNQLNIVSGFLKPKKNEYVYFDKFSHDRLYFLKRGYIKIGYFDEQGNEVVREVLKEGDIFGQIGLERYDHEGEFAQAIKGEASICSFTIADFEEILKKRPDLAISFTKLVGLKFKKLQNRLTNIVYKDVKQRLIVFFITFSENNNPDKNDKIIIQNYLTHAEIASLIGSTRQTVTTLINKMEEDGILYFERKQILIPSFKKLKMYSIA